MEYIIRVNDNDLVDSGGNKRVEEINELVRCMDCKHYKMNAVYPGTKTIMNYCTKTGLIGSEPNWYCADGERNT